jgi:hypothetical protein
MISDAIEIGRRLKLCKEIVGHGRWLPWLDEQFGWTDRTALNFMRVHTLAAKSEKFSDLALDDLLKSYCVYQHHPNLGRSPGFKYVRSI